MDTMNHDQVRMIIELARMMQPDRRGRFLDVACGDNAELYAKVNAQLNAPSLITCDGMDTRHTAISGVPCAEPGSIEAIALEAVSSEPQLNDGNQAIAEIERDDQPIDVFCAQQQLTPVARLQLFQKVCRAIDQAHRHGLIHGGLTPQHIRLFQDGTVRIQPVALRDSLITDPISLRFTSPEQILGDPVTTATDIYHLGIVLYELMTDRFPYRTMLQETDEICEAISVQAPERPSDVVTRERFLTGDRSTRFADQPGDEKQVTSAALRHFLAGDLDLIMLKALHKEPERRYDSARQFANDIDAFLQGRPVMAHGDSRFYRVGKWTHRHPLGTALGLILVTGFTVGLISTTVSLVRTRRERDRAQSAYRIAHRTVENLFTRVQEDHTLDTPSLQPARQALLEPLLRYYENPREASSNDLEALAEAARAQKRVAQIDRLLGLDEFAVWQYESALERYEVLTKRHPGVLALPG